MTRVGNRFFQFNTVPYPLWRRRLPALLAKRNSHPETDSGGCPCRARAPAAQWESMETILLAWPVKCSD